ncbi:hypothetical protein Ancab_032970 [Ancistrocladus abbreviatus]
MSLKINEREQSGPTRETPFLFPLVPPPPFCLLSCTYFRFLVEGPIYEEVLKLALDEPLCFKNPMAKIALNDWDVIMKRGLSVLEEHVCSLVLTKCSNLRHFGSSKWMIFATKAGEPPFASLAQFTAVRVHCRRSPPEEAHRRGLARFQKGGGLSTQFAAGGGPLPVSTSKHCCRFGRFPAIFYEFRRFFAKFSSFPSGMYISTKFNS